MRSDKCISVDNATKAISLPLLPLGTGLLWLLINVSILAVFWSCLFRSMFTFYVTYLHGSKHAFLYRIHRFDYIMLGVKKNFVHVNAIENAAQISHR